MKTELNERFDQLNIQFSAFGYIVSLPQQERERILVFIKAEIKRENERCQAILARVFEDLGEQDVSLDQLQRAVTIAQLPDFI